MSNAHIPAPRRVELFRHALLKEPASRRSLVHRDPDVHFKEMAVTDVVAAVSQQCRRSVRSDERPPADKELASPTMRGDFLWLVAAVVMLFTWLFGLNGPTRHPACG